MGFIQKIRHGYTSSLLKVEVFLKSGETQFKIDVEEGKTRLPWGEEVSIPETPEAPKPYFPACGVVPAGTKRREAGKVEIETEDGSKLIFFFHFEYTLTEPLTARRWKSWSWKEENGKVIFDSNDWRVNLPFPEDKLGTKEEFDFLVSNKVCFLDWDGDSMMSSTHYGYWYERISFLSNTLGVPDPCPGIKARLEQERRAELETVECVLSRLRESSDYSNNLDFDVREGVVYIKFGEHEITSQIPAVIYLELRKGWKNLQWPYNHLENKQKREFEFMGKKISAEYTLPV